MNFDADNKQIIEMLKDMKQQMQTIENKIDELNTKSTNVEQDLRNHIYFIESTYKIVRTPLNYITNKINNLIHTSRETSELPMIENSTTV